MYGVNREAKKERYMEGTKRWSSEVLIMPCF